MTPEMRKTLDKLGVRSSVVKAMVDSECAIDETQKNRLDILIPEETAEELKHRQYMAELLDNVRESIMQTLAVGQPTPDHDAAEAVADEIRARMQMVPSRQFCISYSLTCTECSVRWTGRKWQILAHGHDIVSMRSLTLVVDTVRGMRKARKRIADTVGRTFVGMDFQPVAPVRSVTVRGVIKTNDNYPNIDPPADPQRPGVIARWHENREKWVVDTPDSPYYSRALMDAEYAWAVDKQCWLPYPGF